MRRLALCVAVAMVLIAGCTNWDRLEPEDSTTDDSGRSFTRVGDEPETLTNDTAVDRVTAIQQAVGAERVALIDQFLEDYPQARLIGDVHRLAGEGYMAAGDAETAAQEFERALVMTRTDLLGMPLEPDLTMQLGMAQLSAGKTDTGLQWLARTSIIDHSPRVEQALRWAHAQQADGSGDIDAWVEQLRAGVMITAPAFSLPGLSQEQVRFDPAAGRVTLINFWSPT